LEDDEKLEDDLAVARVLIRAGGNGPARQLLLRAARAYRAGAGRWSGAAEAALLNGFYNLRDEELTRRLLAGVEQELLHDGREDSGQAGRWYVTLALSTMGHFDDAGAARGSLASWRTDRQRSGVRDCLLALLRDAQRGVRGASLFGPLEDQLAAFR